MNIKESKNRLLPILIILFELSFFGGCLSQSFFKPTWVSQTPRSDHNRHFAVGGPGETLEAARENALKMFSEVIQVQITSTLQDYTSVSYNDVTRTIFEKSNSWVRTESNAVVVGIREDERWFDRNNNQWWVLASISIEDLKESVIATAEEMQRKQKVIKENSGVAKNIIEAVLENIPDELISERIATITEAMYSIIKLEFADELYFSSDERQFHAIEYLNNLLRKQLNSIQVKADGDRIVFYQDEETNLKLTVSSTLGPVGKFRWKCINSFTNQSTTILTNTNGVGTARMFVNWDEYGDGEIVLRLFDDSVLSLLGLDALPTKSLPAITYKGRIGISFELDVPQEYQDYASLNLIDLLELYVSKSIVTGLSDLSQVVIKVNSEKSSALGNMVAVRSSVTMIYNQFDGSVSTFSTDDFVGFGGTYNKAFKDSFDQILISVRQDPSLEKFLRENSL